MTRSIPTLLALLALAAPAIAQDVPTIAASGTRPLISPEGTYVFQHIPNSDLVFEGQIAPRIIIMDSIGRATQRVLSSERRPVWGYQVSTTPMVRLRMFSETSNPVRTPSYMPKGTVQFARLRNLTSLTDPSEPEFNEGPVELLLFDIVPFGHHSNGQNGCLFTDQVRREEDDECVDADGPRPRQVNRENGSFSTNYIEAMAYYGRMHLRGDLESADYATAWEWRVGAGVQLNPEGYVGGSIKEELAPLYGATRILLGAMAARRDLWRCGRASADLRLQVFTDGPEGVPPVITRLEANCLPKRWGGAGIFVAFYHGQDYYNLGFAEKISRLQFGVTLQREQFLSFRIASGVGQ